MNLRKERRRTAGCRSQNQDGGELSHCGCMVMKKRYYNKHTCMYQTTNSWVTDELGGWFYCWPLTTRYQQRNSTLLTTLCQNTHRLAGRSILAEKWYWAVYRNIERKKRTSQHVCFHVWHSNGPSDCVGEEWAYECGCVHGESDCRLRSGLIEEFKNILTEGERGGGLLLSYYWN